MNMNKNRKTTEKKQSNILEIGLRIALSILNKKMKNPDSSTVNRGAMSYPGSHQKQEQASNTVDFSAFLKNLTSTRMTPSQLGYEAGISAKAINQLLVEKGFQKRLPSGDYKLTEKGRIFGEPVLKTNRYNYTFQNIEWDSSVLDQIFTAEERSAQKAEKVQIQKIVWGEY